jgi:hypothetical protein
VPRRIEAPLVELGQHRRRCWFTRGCSLQRAQQRTDTPEHRGKGDSVGSQTGCEVGFGEHGAHLRPVQEPDFLFVASEGPVAAIRAQASAGTLERAVASELAQASQRRTTGGMDEHRQLYRRGGFALVQQAHAGTVAYER